MVSVDGLRMGRVPMVTSSWIYASRLRNFVRLSKPLIPRRTLLTLSASVLASSMVSLRSHLSPV